ncbi:hypothetical protein PEC302107_15610 [Pectobacterium araliae]|uniref:Uncharacterized protein n=1 Tax=Pectobacterium araliae TaxID=3073862 RepID=A0AAN0KHF7_9GAMM|nr:hypothetical protein PEC302110_25910 [Pectobacterium sp. MAFF 302110]GKW19832.1 hypothetical protein PEC302107_15610 [Pectobacterium carotovorum subsp. carotovorum]
MFEFKEFIKAGRESASLVEKNHKDIGDVFRSLNKELKNESDGHLTISRISQEDIFSEWELIEEYNGSSELNLLSTGELGIVYDDAIAEIAMWAQHTDGYPFTIEYLGERVDCWDQESLANALGTIVSSAQFWLKVKELSSRVEAKRKSPS